MPCLSKSAISMSTMERPRILLRLWSARSNLGLDIGSEFFWLLDKIVSVVARPGIKWLYSANGEY